MDLSMLLKVYVRLIRLSRTLSLVDLNNQPPCLVHSCADLNELIEDIEEAVCE